MAGLKHWQAPGGTPSRDRGVARASWVLPIAILTLTVVGLGAGHPITQPAQPWSQEAHLVADDAQAGEWAGSAVAIEGGTAVVGAPSDPDAERPGRVLIYEHGAEGWDHTATIEGTDNGGLFGTAVNLEGDTLAVGNPRGNTPDAAFAGGVHIYERATTGWVRTAIFAANDSTLGDQFGTSVALDGETLAVGAKGDDPHGLTWEGSAYVFTRTEAGWAQQAKLIPSDPDELARFGYSIDVDGDTIVVGVRSHDRQAIAGGTAFVFERTGDAWDQTAQLWPSDPGPFHRFGASVTLEGTTLLVGAPGSYRHDFPGAAYVFEPDSLGAWTQTARLEGDGDPEDVFGRSLAVHGDRVAVGDSGADESDLPPLAPGIPRQGKMVGAGAVFMFERGTDAWQKVAKVMADDSSSVGFLSTDDGLDLAAMDQNRFGSSVDLHEDQLLTGAWADDTEAGNNAGSAYLFHPCRGEAISTSLTTSACTDPGEAVR